jgi:hypothetical protein
MKPAALAAVLVAVTGVLLVFALVLNTGQAAPEGPSDAAAIALMLALLAFPATGYVLASRRPRNPIGWLFLIFGLGFFGALGLEEYAVRTLVTQPGSLPFGIWAAWLSSWMWILWMASVALTILLFPDGRLATTRARPLLWLVLLWAGLQFILAGLAPRPLPAERLAAFSNPLAIDALAPLASLEGITGVGVLFLLLAALATLLLRLRRAHGRERLQLRWFAYAAGLVLTVALLLLLTGALTTLLRADLGGIEDLVWFAFIASFAGLPLATAIAILRHRLYDIDLLINRTLVYGAVTALLAATYFGSVVLIQASLRPFTAGSEFAVAASTLLVAALFQPLRRRVQNAVDRRFYRSRYDAARTLDAFGLRLRDEVDLDSVRADLLDVVRETVRPAHASLWLRR